MFNKIPTAISDMIKLDPPELINGKALPAKGKRFTMTAILINASSVIHIVKPAARSAPSGSGDLWAIDKPRQRTTTYIPTRMVTPNTPVSSPTTAKILSVWGLEHLEA